MIFAQLPHQLFLTAQHVDKDGKNAEKTQKNEKLKAIYRTAHSSMPLPAYTWAHIEAELSKEDREKIRDWTGVRK